MLSTIFLSLLLSHSCFAAERVRKRELAEAEFYVEGPAAVAIILVIAAVIILASCACCR